MKKQIHGVGFGKGRRKERNPVREEKRRKTVDEQPRHPAKYVWVWFTYITFERSLRFHNTQPVAFTVIAFVGNSRRTLHAVVCFAVRMLELGGNGFSTRIRRDARYDR